MLIILIPTDSFSQKTPPPPTQRPPFQQDSLLQKDTVKTTTGNSKLESEVQYTAVDSMRFDIDSQKVYLFGQAEVQYKSINLKANYIEISLEKSILFAKGTPDSTGKVTGNPVFEDNGKSFTSKKMAYNFETKKGKISDVITQEGEGYLHGEQVKKADEEVFYIKDGKYTTCDLEDPHFHIQATKLKVIQNDKIVTGPAYLMIEDIPTPLAVPFGFFPNKEEEASGIILPKFGNSPAQGFNLTEGGYYWAINDYVDLSLLGDIYSRGSWRINPISNYKKRYKYNGYLDLSYSETVNGISRDFPDANIAKDFFVKWKFNQDAKAHPNSRFSADVNAGTSSNYKNNLSSSVNNYLTNTFKSNISYNKTFSGTPFNLSLNGSHSQNTRDSTITLTVPQATFTASRMYPFKKLLKSKTRRDSWYNELTDNIGLRYTGRMKNEVTAREDSLFTTNTLSKMENGMQHTLPVNTSFKLLKYFTFSFGGTYSYKMYLETIEKQWDEERQEVDTDTISGFDGFGQVNASSSISTNLYGMYTFRSERIKAIRHVLRPTVSFNIRPGYSKFYKSFQSDSTGNTREYSRFDNGIYGAPSKNESGAVSFDLNNNLEMKVRSNKDTLKDYKKIKILESFNFKSSYDIYKDSLNWDPVSISGFTTILQFVNLRFNGTLDPYALDDAGNAINTTQWNQNQSLGRLTSANLAVGIRLKSKKDNKKEENKPSLNEYMNFDGPWSFNINYNFRYSKPRFDETITNTLDFSGDVEVTPNWQVGFRSGYDFQENDFSTTVINIARDLHCWEMRMRIIPFGDRKSYNVDINVKASVLQSLKVSRNRNWSDFQE